MNTSGTVHSGTPFGADQGARGVGAKASSTSIREQSARSCGKRRSHPVRRFWPRHPGRLAWTGTSCVRAAGIFGPLD